MVANLKQKSSPNKKFVQSEAALLLPHLQKGLRLDPEAFYLYLPLNPEPSAPVSDGRQPSTLNSYIG